MTTPLENVSDAVHDVTGYEPRRSGKSLKAKCPAHEDKTPSLSITEGDDGRALVHCHAGCKTEAIVAAIGLTMSDLMPPRSASGRSGTPSGGKPKRTASSKKVYPSSAKAIAAATWKVRNDHSQDWNVVAFYQYTKGFVVIRFEPPDGSDKTFLPIHLGKDGWSLGDPKGPLPLYLQDKLADTSRIYMPEGEKAADAAKSIGLTVTTWAHGAKATDKTDFGPLAGREVVLLPDNDEPGQRAITPIVSTASTLHPLPVIKIVNLPGLPPGGDIHDYITAQRAGGVKDETIRAEVEALAEAAKPVDLANAVSGAPVMVRLADVEPEVVEWLWQGRVALGKLSMLVGDPDLGKSTVTLDIAARVSKGMPWPDAPSDPNPAGGVVLLSAEDDLGDTIRPRLDAAGADVSKVNALKAVKHRDAETGKLLDEPFQLATDLVALERAIEQTEGCRLVVIDPIDAYLAGVDSHKNADIRTVLAPLADLAARHHVAVLAVRHLNKNEGVRAIHRSMGSVGFVAAARAVWIVTRDKDDDDRRLFLVVKNNLAGERTGLAYRLVSSGHVSKVEWEDGPVTISADEALTHQSEGEATERDQAKEWLSEALKYGPVEATRILAEAKENGYAERTVRRAAKGLGIKPRKSSYAGSWVWDPPQDQEDDPQNGHEVSQDGHQDGHTQ